MHDQLRNFLTELIISSCFISSLVTIIKDDNSPKRVLWLKSENFSCLYDVFLTFLLTKRCGEGILFIDNKGVL